MPYLISYDEVLYQALNNKLSRKIVNNGFRKLFDLKKPLDRITSRSNIPYPPIIIIPEARIMVTEENISAIIYADLSIRRYKDKITPVVEFLLPFLLYGGYLSHTVVLAHELLHYLYLAIKSYTKEYFIRPLISTSDLPGRLFLEETYQVKPEALFGDDRLSKLLGKFEEIVKRDHVAYKIKRNWINKKLPTKIVLSSDFKINVSIEELSKLYFPPKVLSKASDIINEQRSE